MSGISDPARHGLDVTTLGDAALSALLGDVRGEIHRRALASGDVQAVVEEAFAESFDAAGDAHTPFVHGGLLVCPGSRVNTSAANHRCRFAVVAGDWVWDCADLVHDEIRQIRSAKGGTHSVSLVALTEGLEVDVVTSRAKSGSHECQRVDSYSVVGGTLVKVGARRPRGAPADH
jgi:hypothetical protein